MGKRGKFAIQGELEDAAPSVATTDEGATC